MITKSSGQLVATNVRTKVAGNQLHTMRWLQLQQTNPFLVVITHLQHYSSNKSHTAYYRLSNE